MPLAQFDGALAVVTGAGSGFGRAIALALAEQGASVIAADIDLPAAERTVTLAKTLGPGGAPYEVDVADRAAMETFAAEVKEAHRVPDIVVNNAGIAVTGPFMDTGVDDWERILGVNLWGVVHGSRLFGRQMVDRVTALPNKPDKPNLGGHIVNIASAAAFAPWRSMPAYCTTKSAVLMLSQSLRAELAGHRIGVTAVCPGFANTNIAKNATFVGGDAADRARLAERGQKAVRLRGYPPEKVAERVIDAIIKNRAVVPVNFEGHLLHALSRISPGATRLLARIPAHR
ncbi:SDR family NAD(P)-dependent oxidoreductase [Actinomadura algeriensis]|uniref:NAD(P)-dependent dehydrogenase (Short-subunit alcohol dehydrogenase family) n=1 Tax=Actinomadura algeriensis TaxID=1679523 RepID=A0ABR9JKL4_9ACTN|nr:SDR family NAD(P)-dependent oxidoreductase [Actinomadura algeriensis]MBE1530999.1 NAD(P)-dependent dehydrogenase (short-subunit alcohol dehydrogenase family) [Actinomadura algeriensis]